MPPFRKPREVTIKGLARVFETHISQVWTWNCITVWEDGGYGTISLAKMIFEILAARLNVQTLQLEFGEVSLNGFWTVLRNEYPRLSKCAFGFPNVPATCAPVQNIKTTKTTKDSRKQQRQKRYERRENRGKISQSVFRICS